MVVRSLHSFRPPHFSFLSLPEKLFRPSFSPLSSPLWPGGFGFPSLSRLFGGNPNQSWLSCFFFLTPLAAKYPLVSFFCAIFLC